MIRTTLLALAVMALSETATAFSPSASMKPTLSLRSSSSVKPTAASFAVNKRRGLALMMSGGEEPPQAPVEEKVGAYTEEDERKYILQNTGTGYRKNSQDSLLFAMGLSILLIPLIAVAIAVGTGYIPLDYVR